MASWFWTSLRPWWCGVASVRRFATTTRGCGSVEKGQVARRESIGELWRRQQSDRKRLYKRYVI
eukprot:2668713-Pleurochrysis_carterae.AAC.1